MNPILRQLPSDDDTLSSSPPEFFHSFDVGRLFARTARSKKGVGAFKILQFLFALAFLKKSFFDMMRQKSLPWPKDTFYRFLSESRINWRHFLLLVAKRIIDIFLQHLTAEKKDRVLILDDSTYSRDRNKKAESLSKCYDHCDHRHFSGFRMLALAWSDGQSFLLLAFSLIDSAKEDNRVFGAGLQRRTDFGGKTPEAALALLNSVLVNGVKADYLLFDSWFTTNQFLYSVHGRSAHVIAILKDFNSMQFLAKQKYSTNKRMKLGSLYEKVSHGFGKKEILGSALVEIDNGKDSPEAPLSVEVMFVRNRKDDAKRELLAIPCTHASVPDDEIARLYGKRWAIEIFFKTCKSMLRLAKEFQTRSYDSLVAHTSIVFRRYMMLSFEQRRAKDDRACGELFRCCCEELDGISFVASLALLLETLKTVVHSGLAFTEDALEKLFGEFVKSMPAFLRKSLGVSLS